MVDLVAMALLLASGAALSAQPVTPDRAEDLERLVRQDCGSCHGLHLTGGLGTAITPEALAGRDPVALADLILHGVPDTAMPPWQPLLTETEARWIADYLLQPKGLAE